MDGQIAQSIQQKSQFTQVMLDGQCLQNNQAAYVLLHKPQGVVSATQDSQHTTVLDLIEHPQKSELHIVGRLDLNTTGLVLLTNDGAWSRQVSLPQTRLVKTYDVQLAQPVGAQYAAVFAQGIYFAYENITTQPAQLEILSAHRVRLSLVEGKYHQVKHVWLLSKSSPAIASRISWATEFSRVGRRAESSIDCSRTSHYGSLSQQLSGTVSD